jgi:hypothetical protein
MSDCGKLTVGITGRGDEGHLRRDGDRGWLLAETAGLMPFTRLKDTPASPKIGAFPLGFRKLSTKFSTESGKGKKRDGEQNWHQHQDQCWVAGFCVDVEGLVAGVAAFGLAGSAPDCAA